MLTIISCLLLSSLQTQPAQAWTTQTFSEGISMSVPVKLTKSDKVATDVGMARIDSWVGTKGLCSFVIGVSIIKEPEKTPTSALFTNTVDGLLDDGVVIVGEKDLLIQGWPGLAVTLRGKDGNTLVSRTYRSENKLVTSLCVYPTKNPRTLEIDKFLDSIRFPKDGQLKVAGAEMTRYPLGDSGLTALFPRTPEKNERNVGKGNATGTMYTFASDYGLRSFEVAYRDMPASLMATLQGDQLDQAEYAVIDDIMNSFHATKGKQKNESIGKDQGINTEFTIKEFAKGQVLVYIHESRMIITVAFAPRTYEDPKLVDLFLHSVESKK